MNQKLLCQQIAKLTKVIVDTNTSRDDTQKHVEGLNELLRQVSALEFDRAEQNTGNSELTNGLALSPMLAASCATNHIRTQRFHQGVHQYLTEQADSRDPVEILYAGSGPFATLLFPILFLHPNLTIKVTILDIHKISISGVERLFKAAEFSNVTFAAYATDATTWSPPEQPQLFDLILSETMDRGLKHEPQVSIFKHLCQFLKPQGQLIPEQISVLAGLSSNGEFRDLGPLFQLNKSTSKDLLRQDKSYFEGNLVLPKDVEKFSRLVISTNIHIYGEHHLRPNESEMTTDFSYWYLDLTDETHIAFRYSMEKDPGFEFDLPFYQAPLPPKDLAIVTDSGTPYLYLFWHGVVWDFHKPRRKQTNQQLQTRLSWDNVILMMDAYDADLQQAITAVLDMYPPCFTDFEHWFLNQFGRLSEQDSSRLNHILSINHQSSELTQ